MSLNINIFATHLSRMQFPTLVYWTSPFPFKGCWMLFFIFIQISRTFYKQTVETLQKLIGPVSSKSYKLAFAPIEDSDQPAHSCSLISVFDVRSMSSQASNIVSGGFL